jgi:Spy/CpxP family protein refolding chaperone
MMIVRSAVLVCGLSIAAVSAAVAQDQAPPPPPPGTSMQGPPPGGGRGGMMDPGRRTDMLKQNLNLSDDQASQVKAIFEDSRTKMEGLRSNSSLSQDDRRSQMMTIRKAENDKVEALLTPDQKTKYAALQEQMRGRMRNGSPNGGTPQTPQTPPAPQS